MIRIKRLLQTSIVLVVLLSACNKSTQTTIIYPSLTSGSSNLTNTPSLTNINTRTNTPTLVNTFTNSQTPTSTNQPSGFSLRYYQEPGEVITPENINKVQKIGRLEFDGQLVRYAWSPDGSKLGVSVLNHALPTVVTPYATIILDALTFQEIRMVDGYGYVAFSYDGQTVETGGLQYNVNTGVDINHGMGTVSNFPGSFEDIEFSPNGEYIAAAGTNYVDLFPMGGTFRHTAFNRDGASPMHASISPDSQMVAVDYEFESFVEIVNPYSLKPIRRLKLVGMGSGGKARFYRDSNDLYVMGAQMGGGQSHGYIQEWNYRTGIPVSVFPLPPGGVFGEGITMDISPLSDTLINISSEGEIYIMPLHSCRYTDFGKVGGSFSSPIGISFRPDGKLFAVQGRGDDGIDLWGIPKENSTPTVEANSMTPTELSAPCPKIPMVVDNPVPVNAWDAW